jgi:twitching motility two-component system response regulator PilH
VLVANNVEEGTAKTFEIESDLVSMGVVMLKTNGFRASRNLGQDPDASTILAIIISTKGERTDKIWGMRQGTEGHLIKHSSEEGLMVGIDKVRS